MDRPFLPHGCRPLFGSSPAVVALMFTTLVQRTNEKSQMLYLKRRDATFVQQVITDNLRRAKLYYAKSRPTRSEGKSEREHDRRVVKRVDRFHPRLRDIGVDIARRQRRRADDIGCDE